MSWMPGLRSNSTGKLNEVDGQGKVSADLVSGIKYIIFIF